MNTKKLCSLGILDININLFLYESQIMDMNLKLDSYNSVDELYELLKVLNSNLFSNKNNNINNKGDKKELNDINYEHCISLDSDNCLINTLLYINKAYKVKTFIEFIIPDKFEFNDKNKYFKNFIDEILAKNYLFIVESDKRSNNFSKINFIIKIIDDLYDKIKSTKKFELIGKNTIAPNEGVNILTENDDFQKKFMNQFNYNFNKINFFIVDLKEIRKILTKAENIYNFLLKIINRFPRLKIILIIDENIINDNYEKEEIIYIKKYIELCDIIFSFKNNLNNFLRFYYSSNKREITDKNPSKIFFLLKNKNNILNTLDLITKDFSKYRKSIPRTSIILDEFNSIQIYEQDIKNNNMTYNDIFPTFLAQEELTECKNNYILNNANILYHIFISGFLSRLVYNKTFDICFEAGNLLMKKALNILSNKDLNMKNNNFKVNVKNSEYKFLKQIKSDFEKEKNFVLDCTNKEKSKQKEYDILTDNNCIGFLTRKYFLKNNTTPTLRDKVNIFLKGKRNKTNINFHNKNANNDIKFKEKNFFHKNDIKNLLPFIPNNDIKKYKNAKENLNSNNEKNLKSISYYSHSRHININDIKKSIHTKNRINNCLHNINKAENYDKYLFKMYFPHQNFLDYKNCNNL